MKCVCWVIVACCVLLAPGAGASSEDSTATIRDSNVTTVVDTADTNPDNHIVVYYLHGNRRCATCKKLEAYSEEAVRSEFAEGLKNSTIQWRVVNFEEKEHKHFIKDYQLYAQSLVLSEVHDGEEVAWRNLKDIWKLVGDKEKFITYVSDELRAFMSPSDKDTDQPAVE